jgi:hypothetical protein
MGIEMHLEEAWVALQHDPHHHVNGEEGAHSQNGERSSHLPLRGKLDG